MGAFQENPFKYNVLDPNKNWTWQQNEAFINQAVKNGDNFMIMRSPTAWNNYTTEVYGQGSRLAQEMYLLQQSGVGSSRIYNMY